MDRYQIILRLGYNSERIVKDDKEFIPCIASRWRIILHNCRIFSKILAREIFRIYELSLDALVSDLYWLRITIFNSVLKITFSFLKKERKY